jgi:hypothetical protein
MSKISANPEAMDNMIQILVKFIELQDDVTNSLKSQYENIGDEWNDPKYEELGEVINQAISSIKGSYVTLSTCITQIQLLKSIMEDYMAQHMG